jgi:hypothetical protein
LEFSENEVANMSNPFTNTKEKARILRKGSNSGKIHLEKGSESI